MKYSKAELRNAGNKLRSYFGGSIDIAVMLGSTLRRSVYSGLGLCDRLTEILSGVVTAGHASGLVKLLRRLSKRCYEM